MLRGVGIRAEQGWRRITGGPSTGLEVAEERHPQALEESFQPVRQCRDNRYHRTFLKEAETPARGHDHPADGP